MLNASFETVKVGIIDRYYSSKISKDELKSIILDIESTLETQLNVDVFDYSSNGKPINLLYVSASKLERRLDAKLQKLKSKQRQIEQLQDYFKKNQKSVLNSKKEFEKRNTFLNKKIKKFNSYVKSINKRKSLSSSEYKKIKAEIDTKKRKLDRQIKKLKKDKNIIKRAVNKYNNNIRSYNFKVREYHRINKEIETLSRGFKKVKGRTFGMKEIKTKTYYKDGQKIEEKIETNKMDKIEIYGFESKDELKAVLAHEILHLVGIPHIQNENALMNPIMQKNQIRNLSLTYDDIVNFDENF